MRIIGLTTALGLALLGLTAPGAARADGAGGASADAQATYADIKKTLGLVPSFMKAFPEEAISAVWDEYKGTELNASSAIPGKYKELIGLAVAAQVPCRYCTYFHTEVARLNGADPRELKEAVVMASITRKWSTILNGQQTDDAAFKTGMDKVFSYVKQARTPQAAISVTDASSAYRDIEQTLGLVPPMFKLYPPAGIAGAWREFKTVQLNPRTAIPGKYKELIGLAVAAQIPCRFCVYFHTEAAKLNGASEGEISEALAMAGLTRHWSTFLNGTQTSEAAFRKEVDQVTAIIRKRSQTASR
jgi:AhpD family alkylhydroperoxidase